jgi:hypothetical protein
MLTPGFAYRLRWRRNGEETGTAGPVCDSTMRLYLGNRHFFCRHCYRLRYACQLEHEWDRLLRRREKLESRLGEDGWSRPKGMHRRTYDRLADELMSIEDRLDVAMIARWTPDLLPR